jgi:hypothetical protein
MTVPLKLKDSASADFVQFSSTEENYLAYQAGLHLASGDSSDVGSLALSVHGSENLIGNLTDTSYDQPVGTGGDNVSLTFSTTTTPIRQTKGTLTPSGSNNRLPVMQRDSDGQRVIREMNDSDMSVLLDRINTRIFTSDYPGTYKLATSTPTGGYTLDVANVTTDTRTDGTSNQYNLYRRTSMTAPTKVLPFSVKRSSGDTGTYQGLQLMTDDQVKYSIGTRLQNRISSQTNGVGSYKIYSSAAGTPTNNGLSGTWTSKGTATDTRQAIVDANYTRGRVSTYTKLRTSTYSADYQRTRNSAYSRASTVTRSSSYTATYSKTRESQFTVSGFIGNFIGNYTTDIDRIYTRTSSRDVAYSQNYSADYVGVYSRLQQFTGNYGDASPNAGGFTRISTVIQDFAGNYTGNFLGNYIRQGQYIGNYTGDFLGNYTRDRQTNLAGTNSTQNFLGNYSRQYLRNRQSNYSRDYLRTRQSNYTRDRASFSQGNFLGEYARNFSRNRQSNYVRTSIDPFNYTRSRLVGRAKDNSLQYYIGNYTGTNFYTRSSVVTSGTLTAYIYQNATSTSDKYWRLTLNKSTNPSNYVVFPDGGTIFLLYGPSTSPYYVNKYLGSAYELSASNTGTLPDPQHVFPISDYENVTQYNGTTTIPPYEDFVSSLAVLKNQLTLITGYKNGSYEYQRGILQSTNIRTYDTQYFYSLRFRVLTSYVGNFSASYLGEYARNFVANYSRNFTRNSTVNYGGSFTGDYTRNFQGNYSRNFQRTFIGNYTRNFERTRQSNYLGGESFSRGFLGNFIGNFSRNFTSAFEGNYSRNFAGNYTGNYARTFLGNFNTTFTGNYAGETIGSGNTNIETYTLYVRTA